MLNIISDLHSFYYTAPPELKLNCDSPAINISRLWRYVTVKQMKSHTISLAASVGAGDARPFGTQGEVIDFFEK